MRKIAILAIVAAVIAMLALPMAVSAQTTDGTVVSGVMVQASVSISVPDNLQFNNFVAGWNIKNWEAFDPNNSGNVTVTPGTSGIISWTVTAQGPAYMAHSSTNLTMPLLIGNSTSGPWSCADGTSSGDVHGTNYSGTLTYSGTDATHQFDFAAAQYIETSDANVAGAYTDIITFTASCVP